MPETSQTKPYLGIAACAVSPQSFEDLLRTGQCFLMLDGVNDVTDDTFRNFLVEISRSYSRCPILLTTRPTILSSGEQLSDFKIVDVQSLNRDEIKIFAKTWSILLHPNSPHKAEAFVNTVLDTLKKRPDLKYVMANPGMLTIALALWSGETPYAPSRDVLFEGIVSGIVLCRQDSRDTAHRIVEVLQELAVAMQIRSGGRTTSVPIDWAAEKVAPSLGAASLTPALDLLEHEPAISGAIKVVNRTISFCNTSFQEFLVARSLATRLEKDQIGMLRDCATKLLSDEWLEPLRFLAERFASRNPDRLTHMLAFLGTIGESDNPCDQVRTLVLMRSVALLLAEPSSVYDHQEYKNLLNKFRPLVFSTGIRALDPNIRTQLGACYGPLADPRLSAPDWVSIESGTFCMGAQKENRDEPRFDERARSDESPVRQIFVPGFQISRFPVSVGQFRQFVDDRGYGREDLWRAGAFGQFRCPTKWSEQQKQLNCPVVGVSWYEAAAFCSWADARLPSEAEWERAAAGTEGRLYPWGNEQPDRGRAHFKSRTREVAAVGLFPEGQTPDGVFDLAGNSWEWVSDAYGPYLLEPAHREANTLSVSPKRKVLRGGSNISAWPFLRCAVRTWADANQRYSTFGPIGFRCARPKMR